MRKKYPILFRFGQSQRQGFYNSVKTPGPGCIIE